MTDFPRTRAQFHIPDGVIYLDGNSLGPVPKNAAARAAEVIEAEWGQDLIRAWNSRGWMQRPRGIGDRIGRLIGAPEGTVVMGDTLSIKVYQALAAALALNPDRRVILSDNGNFPTDLYMAQGLIHTLGKGHVLKTPAPEAVDAMIDDSVAVLMLTEVDYQTGRIHDMAELTRKAHDKGVITVWDLAHSAGAIEVDLTAADADFAVGCTYKYLNGGPGAPAFIQVAPRHAEVALPALSGWHGHAAPFAFEHGYRPATGIERMRIGTQSIIALGVVDAALDVWDDVDMRDIRARSIELSELFIHEVEARCPNLELASPRDPKRRGSQVSFRFPDGYAAMQALIDRGVIGDFRTPDIMRFGFTPLYLNEEDILKAVAILDEIMARRLWDRDDYKIRAAVT